MPIWIDYREKALLKICPEAKEHSPPVGDIWIGDLSGADLLSGGIILERKTVADLEASIIDGRYTEQRGRLLAYAQTHNVVIGYVIEGSLARNQGGGRLKDSALLKHITRLQLHHKIPVFQTASLVETANLTRLLAEQVADPKHKGEFLFTNTGSNSSSSAVALSYNKGTCRDSPDAFLVGVLTQCRGISETLALILQKKFGGLEGIMAAGLEDLAAASLEGGKRKVGLAVATRLHGLLHCLRSQTEVTESPTLS